MGANIQKNNDSIDVTKFLLSLCVVAIHSELLYNYIYPFVRLAVPIFFIFSGYFSFLKIDAIQNYSAKKEKFISIVKRYLKLYAFWFIVLLPHTLYIRKYFSSGIIAGFLNMPKNFLLDSTFRGSWYLMATILGIIIIFLLSNRFSNAKLLLITIPFYLFSTVFSEFSGEIKTVPFLYLISNTYTRLLGIPCFTFMIALLYIVLGKILADSVKRNDIQKKNIYLFIVCFALLILEYHIRLRSKSFIYSCDCLIMLAPTAYFFVTNILNLQFKFKYSKIFSKLSTIIYCVHFPILDLVKNDLTLSGIKDPMNILKYFITLLLSVSFSLILLKLEKKPCFKFLKYAH